MFLTLEGIDGCGKSTVTRLLAERFADHRVKAAVRHMPRDIVRRNLSGLSTMAQAMLFLTDHAQGMYEAAEVIASKDAWIISDRGWLSTCVYQFGEVCEDLTELQFMVDSAGFLLDRAFIDGLRSRRVPRPERDIFETVILRTPVEECMKRIAARSERDIFESEDAELWKHRDALYGEIAEYLDIEITKTDGKTPDQIADEIWERYIRKHLQ